MGNQVTNRYVSHDEVTNVDGGHLSANESTAKLFRLRQESEVQ